MSFRRIVLLGIVFSAFFATFGLPALGSEITTASGEIPVSGTVMGSYSDTQKNNGIYEAIKEWESDERLAKKRTSYLEHKWTFDVPAGDSFTYHIKAYHSANTEGDDFEFAWSTDDIDYTSFLLVTKTEDDGSYQSSALPSDLSGTVYIRLTDTDRTKDRRVLDTIFIDHMYIESFGGDTPPAPPSDLSALTASDTAIDLEWTDNAGNEDGFRIEHSLDGIIWDPPVTLGADVTSFQDTNLLPDTTYYYHVQAFNSYGDSDWSNVASTATWPPFAFETEVVDPTDAGFASLDYDLNGRPGIAYSKGGFAHFAQWNGVSWDIEIAAEDASAICFAYSPDGRPSFSHGWGSLFFSEKIGSSWSTEVVEDGPTNNVISLAYDPLGNPSIAYNNRTGPNKKRGLWFSRRINGTWITETVDNTLTPNYKSLAYDPQGNPAIAYNAMVDDLKCLKFAHWNGFNWDIEVVESAEEWGEACGLYAQLAYDPTTGWPTIVHTRDSSWRDKLRIVRWNGSAWQGETIVDDGLWSLSKLVFTSQGTPYLGYTRVGMPPKVGLWITHFDGFSWVRELVAGWDLAPGSLALDPNEDPSIAWGRGGELKFAHK